MNERLATCYHEAGHAVIGAVLGMSPSGIRLQPDRQPVAVVTWGADWQRLEPWAGAVVFYAGPAAEARALGCPIDDTLFASDHERSDVRKLAGACGWLCKAGHFPDGETALRYVIDQADALLDHYWPRVEAVALALDRRGRLYVADLHAA